MVGAQLGGLLGQQVQLAHRASAVSKAPNAALTSGGSSTQVELTFDSLATRTGTRRVQSFGCGVRTHNGQTRTWSPG
ncbi:hypothetical protein I553_6627 [Mycobacterium xenopi 4042]|uniref:Uncharacterized protein n=1 Tax=Mycobacterium xenopi 4042 TaxID=1299334 RepID=X8BFZ5_MYCXE|nr:hypothetical protein I553_6627 [Mycobacterium xenopi 4042]